MDKFIIRLGQAPWDSEYINFNPSAYKYASVEYTFNIPYIKIAGSKYLFSVDLSKITDIKNIIDFNSLYVLGYTMNRFGRYDLTSQAYYLIESIDTVNRGNTIITAVEDSLFNIYMYKSHSKIYTRKLGGSVLYDFQSMKDMELPQKDNIIRSNNIKLASQEPGYSTFKGDFSFPYNINNSQNSYNQLDTAGKGFASHYSVYQENLNRFRLYSKYYPFKDTLKPFYGTFRQGSDDEEMFSQTRGKQIVGVQKNYLNNNNLLSFGIFENSETFDVGNRLQMLNRSFYEISAVIGGNEYDLTDYLESENNTDYYDNTFFLYRSKSYFKYMITSSVKNETNTGVSMSSYKYNLYPSDSIYLTVQIYGYGFTNNIFTKAYKIPKSQQMYNKYQKYMIGNYFKLEQQEKETMISFTANLAILLYNLGSPIKIQIDFADIAKAGANTLEFFGGKFAYEKDISSDFAILVGGTQQDNNDIRELTELGFHFKLKSYSKEMLEKIYLRNKLEGSVKNTDITIKDAINNYTYIQGILKVDNPSMGDSKALEALNRGLNSIK